jgi:Ca-activated chloride channel family protein
MLPHGGRNRIYHMPENSKRRNALIALAVLVIVILLLLGRCWQQRSATNAPTAPPTPGGSVGTKAPANVEPAVPEPDEVLGAATLTAPQQVTAGSAFSVAWTGPDNRGDYLTIVPPEAPSSAHGNYRETKHGASVELTAPIQPGAHEVRYVTARSHTVLARIPVEVVPAAATLDAPPEIILGSPFSVAWTGPNNQGDYVTVVPKGTPDDAYDNYTDTQKGSPLTLTAPSAPGDAEVRYVSGQGRKVLARRPLKVITPEVTLSAPADAIAGSTIEVTWSGPNNAGDYITVVPIQTPDGQYGNYTNTSGGSPLKLLLPIMPGNAELRYMAGQGRRVLARRAINITAPEITLSAPLQCAPGTAVSVTWTGPNNAGDYITVVAKATSDGQYGDYINTSNGSPLSVKAPKDPGDAEIRYMTGQGNKVLARIPIQVVPAKP